MSMKSLVPALMLILAACSTFQQTARITNSVSAADSAKVLPTLKALHPYALEFADSPAFPENGEFFLRGVRRCHGGIAHILCVIDEEGNVLSPMLTKGINKDCDEDLLRAISLVKFIPAEHKGKAVASIHEIPLRFAGLPRLPVMIRGRW